MKVILAFVLAITLVVPINNSALGKIEGIVTKGNHSETVQLTFRADRTNGYRADDLNVISKQSRK